MSAEQLQQVETNYRIKKFEGEIDRLLARNAIKRSLGSEIEDFLKSNED